jgi:predicted branched-subunit amino acid permease
MPSYPHPRAAARAGILAGLTFSVVVVPFSMLFGVVATAAGLDLLQVMAFSVLVIAGASQFTAVQLMTEQAPVVVVLVSALAVNLRMAMYSAALAPHLGQAPLRQRVLVAYLNVDQSAAASVLEYERRPEMPLDQKLAYFLGLMVPIAPTWYAGTLAGALAGGRLMPAAGIDALLPLTFLALIAPGLRTRAHWVAAGVAAALGLLLSGLPYSLGLLPAAAAGMVAGAEVERRREAAA